MYPLLVGLYYHVQRNYNVGLQSDDQEQKDKKKKNILKGCV